MTERKFRNYSSNFLLDCFLLCCFFYWSSYHCLVDKRCNIAVLDMEKKVASCTVNYRKVPMAVNVLLV
uniref:Uncharacterized protein n=1 Tax=Anguilla anguilla TaxID=7936 RepID=A0A0E9WI66_ANGAN